VPLPFPTLAITALVLVLALVWWASRRAKVAPPPVALMVTRIEFPDVRLADSDAAVAMLELRDEIVVPFSRATLVIAFPLTHPARVAIESHLPQGFTRGELVRTICDEYAHVYAAEEGTSSSIVEPELRAGRRERPRSDGAYGIWGQMLEDLVLRSAQWVKQSNGEVIIDLHVAPKPLPQTPPPHELSP
jgi:hypothetical protein